MMMKVVGRLLIVVVATLEVKSVGGGAGSFRHQIVDK
jgi:hypothetical protein